LLNINTISSFTISIEVLNLLPNDSDNFFVLKSNSI
jgi:hypothetical protein